MWSLAVIAVGMVATLAVIIRWAPVEEDLGWVEEREEAR